MITSIVVAHDLNGLIGYNNTIPWHYKERYPDIQPSVKRDLKFFREKTLNHCVIMGRTTFKTLPKPLKKRVNIVLSTSKIFDEKSEDYRVITCSNWDKAFATAQSETDDKEVFIIGGANIYRQALEFVDNVYVSLFKFAFEPGLGCKVHFPKLPANYVAQDVVYDDEHYSIVKYQRSSSD